MFAEKETSQSVCHLSQNNVENSKVFICQSCRILHGGGSPLRKENKLKMVLQVNATLCLVYSMGLFEAYSQLIGHTYYIHGLVPRPRSGTCKYGLMQAIWSHTYSDHCPRSRLWTCTHKPWSQTHNHHNHLQILQNKLARVLLHADIRTPIDKMMEDLNWVKLDCRWSQQLLIVTFKCLKEIAPVYLSYCFTFTHSAHGRTTRSQCSNSLVVPPWNIAAGKRTFHYRAASLWNRLPVDVRSKFTDMSLNEFKSFI